MGEDVDFQYQQMGDKFVSVEMADSHGTKSKYMLSDLSVISDPPQMKRLPEFGTKIKLDRSFIDTFIKGKGALSGVDTFTVVKSGDGCEVVILSLIHISEPTRPY